MLKMLVFLLPLIVISKAAGNAFALEDFRGLGIAEKRSLSVTFVVLDESKGGFFQRHRN